MMASAGRFMRIPFRGKSVAASDGRYCRLQLVIEVSSNAEGHA
jgi:hypothetical protein